METAPQFTLEGTDPFAAATLRYYANLVEAAHGSANTINSARAIAQQMDAWPVKITWKTEEKVGTVIEDSGWQPTTVEDAPAEKPAPRKRG